MSTPNLMGLPAEIRVQIIEDALGRTSVQLARVVDGPQPLPPLGDKTPLGSDEVVDFTDIIPGVRRDERKDLQYVMPSHWHWDCRQCGITDVHGPDLRPCHKCSRSAVAFLRVCKTIYVEALPILYRLRDPVILGWIPPDSRPLPNTPYEALTRYLYAVRFRRMQHHVHKLTLRLGGKDHSVCTSLVGPLEQLAPGGIFKALPRLRSLVIDIPPSNKHCGPTWCHWTHYPPEKGCRGASMKASFIHDHPAIARLLWALLRVLNGLVKLEVYVTGEGIRPQTRRYIKRFLETDGKVDGA